jgi:hypothetical protein
MIEGNSPEMLQGYLASLTKKERIALDIAKNKLDSSFDILKSIGYINWCKKESS